MASEVAESIHQAPVVDCAPKPITTTKASQPQVINIPKTKIAPMLLLVCLAASNAYAQESNRSWAAIAIFCLPGNGGCKGVTGGRGYGQTEALARKAAIADCRNGDIDPAQARYCKIVRTFNQGCVYVVASCRKSSSVCGYATGSTMPEAESKCASQGFDCSNPQYAVGGCAGK